MKTKVELDISDAAIDKATKSELNKMRKYIKSLEGKVKIRDDKIYNLKAEIKGISEPARRAMLFMNQINDVMESL